MRDEKLLSVCKDWMSKQDKLELFRDYNDYLEPRQVSEFIDYCEGKYNNGEYDDPESLLYDWFAFDSGKDWFNGYEHDYFDDMYVRPFIKEHPEYEDQEDEVDEILRDLMYELDMYDANLKHFDKEYHFYLLTDPERTVCIRDYPYSFNYREKYYQSLKQSQGWTENMKSMRTLLDGAYDYLGVCIMYNCSLFEFINLMRAKRLTIKKGSAVYLFNPYNGSGGCETDLERDWSFNLRLNEIGFGCDDARKGPWGRTPSDVYGRVHSYFNKNKIYFNLFNLKK